MIIEFIAGAIGLVIFCWLYWTLLEAIVDFDVRNF
jgi:hypothetical protein